MEEEDYDDDNDNNNNTRPYLAMTWSLCCLFVETYFISVFISVEVYIEAQTSRAGDFFYYVPTIIASMYDYNMCIPPQVSHNENHFRIFNSCVPEGGNLGTPITVFLINKVIFTI